MHYRIEHRVGFDVGHGPVTPFSRRPTLFLHREAWPVGDEPVGLEPELRVGGAGAGPEVEAVAVRRADDGASVQGAGRQRGAGVGTPVLGRIELPLALEDRDLGPAHRDRLAAPLGDLVGADRRYRRRARAPGPRWGRAGRLEHAELPAHAVE